ncbi:hypothetical protein MtrunA17_Chr1g0183971 [Medicago truncatula]|nr:hypothetical protein MtrunA17_Chr1g0183971 [Medicago truncatula]
MHGLSGFIESPQNHSRHRRGGRLLFWSFANIVVVVVAFVAVWLCWNGTAVVSRLRQCSGAVVGGSVL